MKFCTTCHLFKLEEEPEIEVLSDIEERISAVDFVDEARGPEMTEDDLIEDKVDINLELARFG